MVHYLINSGFNNKIGFLISNHPVSYTRFTAGNSHFIVYINTAMWEKLRLDRLFPALFIQFLF